LHLKYAIFYLYCYQGCIGAVLCGFPFAEFEAQGFLAEGEQDILKWKKNITETRGCRFGNPLK